MANHRNSEVCIMLIMILKNIRFNNITQLYEVIEAGIKYEFDGLALGDLNKYLKENPTLLIAHWYRALSNDQIKLVKKSYAFTR